MFKTILERIKAKFKRKVYTTCTCGNRVEVALFDPDRKIHMIGQIHKKDGVTYTIYCDGTEI